jgi:hypothetical protein
MWRSPAAQILLCLSLCGPAHAEGRRFLLAVGSNEGDPAEPHLHYAVHDAERFTEALREVGGVQAADAVLLRSPDAPALAAELQALGVRLRREAGAGDQLMIYVSSHADEGNLHLRGSHYAVRDLMAFLRDAPVGVAFLIIDSCRSGSAVQVKGIRPVSGATVEISAPEVTGRVIIGSSGSDEYAQESEILQGSFFTHHFVSALRGAGDASGDGRVTLQEAYDYAFARTVESTFATPAGVQHPTFRMDLRGRGDLVLSEPGEGRGRLVFPSSEPGEYLVLSAAGGDVTGQLVKASGPAMFAVEPGRYRIQLRQSGVVREAEITVPDHGQAVVSDERWTTVRASPSVAKGAATAPLWLGAAGMVDGSPTSGRAAVGLEARGRYASGSGLEVTAVLSGQQAFHPSNSKTMVRPVGTPPEPEPTSYSPSTALLLRAGPGIARRWGALQGAIGAQVGGGVQWMAPSGPVQTTTAPVLCAGLVPELRWAIHSDLQLELAGFGGASDIVFRGQSTGMLLGLTAGISTGL